MAAEDLSEANWRPKHKENSAVKAKDAHGVLPSTRKEAMARSCGLSVGLSNTLGTRLIMIYQ